VDTYVGHDIDVLARGTGIPDGTDGAGGSGLPIPIADYGSIDKGDYRDDYRGFALRGPLLLQSWGYDTDGKPVPNAVDTEVAASGGIFDPVATEDNFLDSWLRKPHTWPVAPVDLRFDRNRGVWVSPPAYKLVFGQIQEDFCDSGTGLVSMTHGGDLYGPSGEVLETDSATSPQFEAADRLGMGYESGENVVAYYDTDACEYVVLNGMGSKGHLGKLNGLLEEGSSASVSIWQNDGGSIEDTTKDVTAYDWMLGAGESIASGTKVIINRLDDCRWYVTNAACGVE
jgi:hypothetical protein